MGPGLVRFKTDCDRILCDDRLDDNLEPGRASQLPRTFEIAGPRERAGKTNMLVGRWHDSFVHIPLKLVIHSRHKIDPAGDIWRFVVEATGQPARML